MINIMQEANPQFQQVIAEQTIEGTIAMYHMCGTIGCILSIFALLGGIFVIQRKFWMLSLIFAAITAIVSLPAIIPIFLSIPAIILLIISRSEFKQKEVSVTKNQ